MSQPTTLQPEGPPPESPGDKHLRRVELAISILLRVGVGLSLVLVIAGTIVSFVRHPDYATSTAELTNLIRPATAPWSSLSEVFGGLGENRGQAVVTLGLLVLIGTPMMRVAVSIVAFLLERDWVYTSITLGVFGLLMLSLLLGATD